MSRPGKPSRRAFVARFAGGALLLGAVSGACSSTSTDGGTATPTGTTARAGGGSTGSTAAAGGLTTSTGAGATSVPGTAPAADTTSTLGGPSGPSSTGSTATTRASSPTTSAGGGSPTTSTGGGAPVTSVAPASSVPLPTPGVTTAPVRLDTQVFWVRPPQEERAIDLPGFRDPADGSRPLVVYGSATNNSGRAVTDPTVRATWVDQQGTPVASFQAAVLRADSVVPATSLAPGQSGDVIIVVTDVELATRLGAAGLVPELDAAGR